MECTGSGVQRQGQGHDMLTDSGNVNVQFPVSQEKVDSSSDVNQLDSKDCTDSNTLLTCSSDVSGFRPTSEVYGATHTIFDQVQFSTIF